MKQAFMGLLLIFVLLCLSILSIFNDIRNGISLFDDIDDPDHSNIWFFYFFLLIFISGSIALTSAFFKRIIEKIKQKKKKKKSDD